MAGRILVSDMITKDLGYCCVWFFFKRYRRTSLIAARLGVSPRAIRYHKSAVNDGLVGCPKAPNCMCKLLPSKDQWVP